jgi:hypothetical protein
MAIGYHPDLQSGALIGVLVAKVWSAAIGEPTIETEGVDDNGNPVVISAPNPDYVPPRDVTLTAILDALADAGLVSDVRDVGYSGASTEELADGNERAYVQCVVAGHVFTTDAERVTAEQAEATLRAAIGGVLAAFAPQP